MGERSLRLDKGIKGGEIDKVLALFIEASCPFF